MKKIMKLKEKLSYFWNITLGVDCPEEVDIETSDNPDMKELQDSLKRVEAMEQGLKLSATGKKSGKGNSSKIVEQVSVDTKAAIKASKEKSEINKETKNAGKELGE